MKAISNGVLKLLAAGWGQFAAALILLGSIRMYTELLPASAFGEAMLVLGGLTLVDGLTGMAFAQTCAQYLKDRVELSERQALGLGMARRVVPYFAAIAGLGCAVFACFAQFAVALSLLAAAVLYVVVEPLRVVSQSIIQLGRRYRLGSIWVTLDALLTLAISGTLIASSFTHGSVLLLGAIGGRVLTTLLLCPLVLGLPRSWRADHAAAADLWPRAMKFGQQVALMAPLGWFGFYFDRYLVGSFLGLEAAGLFAALSGAVSRPFAIASAGMTNLFRPELLDQAAGRAPSISRPLLRWALLASAIGLGGTLAFLLLGDWIARLLIAGSHSLIDDAGMLMAILALSQWVVIETHAVDNELLARGAARKMLVWQTCALLGGAPLIVLGALEFDVLGAAWGRFGNEGLKLLAALFVLASIRRAARSQGAKAE